MVLKMQGLSTDRTIDPLHEPTLKTDKNSVELGSLIGSQINTPTYNFGLTDYFRVDMEGNVVSSHLRRKFSSALNDAEAADLSQPRQRIMSLFRAIESLISSNNQNSGAMVDILYRLMNELSEFADVKGSNMFFQIVRLNGKGLRLNEIRKNIEDIFDISYNTTAWPLGSSVYVPQSSHDVPDPSLITGFESQVDEIEKLMLMPGLGVCKRRFGEPNQP